MTVGDNPLGPDDLAVQFESRAHTTRHQSVEVGVVSRLNIDDPLSRAIDRISLADEWFCTVPPEDLFDRVQQEVLFACHLGYIVVEPDDVKQNRFQDLKV